MCWVMGGPGLPGSGPGAASSVPSFCVAHNTTDY